MSLALLDILTEISKEKSIKLDLVIEAFREVIRTSLKKKYFSLGDIELDVNQETGEIRIFIIKKVVEYVVQEGLEVSYQDAIKIRPNIEIGETIPIEIPFSALGRNVALSAKQMLWNKVREVEKESIVEEYKDRINELFTGNIQKVDNNYVLISSGRAEFFMPRKEQIQGEHFTVGKPIRFVLSHIQKTPYGSQLIASRGSAEFLKALLEVEVPEIYEGIVKIKKVVREAGVKSKIAVYTDMERVDPVGACVGMKGTRIQSIMKQLNGERIDVILWSSDSTVMAMRSLTPGKPKDIKVEKNGRKITAIMPDDQISVTMGKGKINLKLAMRLINAHIDIVKESVYHKKIQEKNQHLIDIHEINSINSKIIDKLISAGIETVQDLLAYDEEELLNIPGVGEKTVEKILDDANQLISQTAKE